MGERERETASSWHNAICQFLEASRDATLPSAKQREVSINFVQEFAAQGIITGPCPGTAADVGPAMQRWLDARLALPASPYDPLSDEEDTASSGSGSAAPSRCRRHNNVSSSSSLTSCQQQLPTTPQPPLQVAAMVAWMREHQGEWSSPPTA